MCNPQIENLVIENLDLVMYAVRKFTNLDSQDSESEGHMALFNAATKFVNNSLEGNFRGYASFSIRNALLDLVSKRTRENALSLDYSYNEDGGENDNSMIDYIVDENNELEMIDAMDVLRNFYEECTESEQHIIATKLTLYNQGIKINQTELCKLISTKYGETIQQAGLCKRLAKLEKRFSQFKEEE